MYYVGTRKKKSLSYIHQRYTKFLQYYYKHNARTASVLVIEKWFVILDRIMTEAFLWALYNNYISLTFHFELNGCYVYIWRRWKICFMPRLNPLKSLSSIFFTSNALIKPSSVNHVMRQLKYSSFSYFTATLPPEVWLFTTVRLRNSQPGDGRSNAGGNSWTSGVI